MFYTKDHKTRDMFDPLDRFGPMRRKLLEKSWAHFFREEILSDLPVQKLAACYSEFQGRPTKELHAMLGLMILQQTHDLTDEEAVNEFAFDLQWHYALNVGESDAEAYVSPRTLWNMRSILTENNLFLPLFESVTDKLVAVFNVDTGGQRIDSVHIWSNMRHLGRIGLFVRTIKKFLRNLLRQNQELYGSLDGKLVERYMSKKSESVFSMVKPSEAGRTLETLANDLFSLVNMFRSHSKVTDMNSYQLMARLLKEQCVVEDAEKTGEEKVSVKPNKEVPSDSLQNPSDPDAGYSGHKGKGYQIQIAETYEDSDEKKQPSLITYVAVEPAHKSDTHALIPFIENTTARGLGPEEVLADTLYGGDENVEKADREMGVEVVSPAKGQGKDGKLSLADFTLSEGKDVVSCPGGHAPAGINHEKDRHTATFDKKTCLACSRTGDCPVKPGKNRHYLHYNDKDIRLAGRRTYEKTPEFRDRYRFRAGIEGTISYYHKKTGVKRLRVRGFPAVSFCAFMKATGVNILRAAMFRNRGNMVNNPVPSGIPLPPTAGYRVSGLIRAVKELFSAAGNYFRDKTVPPAFVAYKLVQTLT